MSTTARSPHLIIEDFFPADIYRRMIDTNPFRRDTGAAWMTAGASAHVTARTPCHVRKQIDFHADEPFDAAADDRAFWNVIRDVFLADDWFP